MNKFERIETDERDAARCELSVELEPLARLKGQCRNLGRSLVVEFYIYRNTASVSLNYEVDGAWTTLAEKNSIDPALAQEITGFSAPVVAPPTAVEALVALLDDHKRMFTEAHPHSTIDWSECEEVKAAQAAINNANTMRNLVIEHNIIGKETGEKLPTLILDGAGWGDDFDNLCSSKPEDPVTDIHDEGFNQATQQWVTYHQTFLRTEKSDEELLATYK
jgi:hypothetical protein